MIQQKKYSANLSRNSFYQEQHNERTGHFIPNQFKRKNSLKQLCSHLNHSVNKAFNQNFSKQQKCGHQSKLAKQKIHSKQQKAKRKQSKIFNLNISSSAVVLPQIKSSADQLISKQKRASVTKFQANNFNSDRQKSLSEAEINLKKLNKKLSKKASDPQKFKQQPIHLNDCSLKKYKLGKRLQAHEKRKHFSCVSLLEGIQTKFKSNSKSKSKSKGKGEGKGKDKDKCEKGNKKKASYKFSKISIRNRQKQNQNKNNHAVCSVGNQLKSITRKLQKLLQSKHRKSKKQPKSHQKDLSPRLEKKRSKITSKQNVDPARRHSKTFLHINSFMECISPKVVIKKEPLHAHRKYSQKFEINLKSFRKKHSQDKNDCYFFIRKIETPSSSGKQFPVKKYCEINQPIGTYQSKRSSFQKNVQPNPRRSSLNEKQVSIYRQISKNQVTANQQAKPQIVTVQSGNKVKLKRSSKVKNQSNVSCLILSSDSSSSELLKRKSESMNDQDLICKWQNSWSKKIDKIKTKTPKEVDTQNENAKETTMRYKNFCHSSKQQRSSCSPQKQSKQNASFIEKEASSNTFLAYGSNELSNSLNIDEIRYYQSISPECYRKQARPINEQKSVLNQATNELQFFRLHFKNRLILQLQLKQKYPLLSKQQLQFLSSICFIQQKWKEVTLARKLKNLISTKNASQLLAKNNSSLSKDCLLLQEKGFNSTMIDKSETKNLTTQSQNTQTEWFLSIDTQENVNQQFFKKQQTMTLKKSQNQKPSLDYEQKCQQEKTQSKHQKSQLTQNLKRAQVIKQQDMFPDMSYLQTKKYLLKKSLLESLSKLNGKLSRHQLQTEEYESQKKILEDSYKIQIKKISGARKTIKKGYLQYLQTFNTINESLNNQNKKNYNERNSKSQFSLNRANSQEGLLSDIYHKIFKLQQLSSDHGSEVSNETKRLNQLFLIRKNASFKKSNHLFDLRKHNQIEKNLGFEDSINTERLRFKLKAEESQCKPSSFRQFKSAQFANAPFCSQQNGKNGQFKENVSETLLKVECSSECSLPIKQSQTILNISALSLGQQSPKTYNISELVQLGQQRKSKLFSSPDTAKQNQQKTHLKQKDELKQPKESTPVQQLNSQSSQQADLKHSFQMEQFDDQIENICFSLQQNHEQFYQKIPAHTSPISSSLSLQSKANTDAKLYLQNFVKYLICNQHWLHQIHYSLNSPLRLTPASYLKYFREFESPHLISTPIIPNEAFIEFEDLNIDHNDLINNLSQIKPEEFNLSDHPWCVYSQLQSKSIEHKCLYELLNLMLEKSRVYGEKGLPFPWQMNYTTHQKNQIQIQFVPKILQNCLRTWTVLNLRFSCGIILQNHPDVLNQEDLEQLHDKNQDQIIGMIQSELAGQRHIWYQSEENILETNFQMSEMAWNEVIDEFIKEFSQIKKQAVHF